LGAIIGYLGRKSHSAGDGAMRAGAVALFCTNSDDIGLAYPFFLGLFPEEKANILFLLSAAQALLIAPWCFVLMEIGDGQAKARAKSRAKAKALCELPQAVLPQAVLPQVSGALESSLSTCFLDSVSSHAAINGMTSSDRAPRTAPPLRTQGNKIVLWKVLLNAARNLACNRLILSALAGLLWNLVFGPVLPWYAPRAALDCLVIAS
jgi:predicted permease